MENNFSKIALSYLERWTLRVMPTAGTLPPNTNDFGANSIMLHFCLYNEEEYNKKLSIPPAIRKIENLRANSIFFDSEGHFPWIVGEAGKLEHPITKEEYDNAYSLIIWSEPLGSAAFQDGNFRRGVLIKLELTRKDEVVSNILNHVIEVELEITESVISYFIDLVMAYSSKKSEFLVGLCKDINNNATRAQAFGKLGVISPSIGENNTEWLAGRNNLAELHYGTFYDSGNEIDLFDLDFWYSEYAHKEGDTLRWGESEISRYDFKAPINQYYGTMFRIGNDAKIYSNEGLSNLDWGILSYQTGIGPDKAKIFANMDPKSRDEIQDDIATDEGYKLAIDSAIDSNKPVSFDRRKLFMNTIKTIQRAGGYYTHLEVQLRNKKEEERDKKLLFESTIYFMQNK